MRYHGELYGERKFVRKLRLVVCKHKQTLCCLSCNNKHCCSLVVGIKGNKQKSQVHHIFCSVLFWSSYEFSTILFSTILFSTTIFLTLWNLDSNIIGIILDILGQLYWLSLSKQQFLNCGNTVFWNQFWSEFNMPNSFENGTLCRLKL